MKMTVKTMFMLMAAAAVTCFTGCSAVDEEKSSGEKSEEKTVKTVPYITFEGNGTFTLGINDEIGGEKAWNGTVYYSTDKVIWTEWNKNDDSVVNSSAVSDGKAYLYLKGKGNTGFTDCDGFTIGDFTIFALTGEASEIACSGNIMTLLDFEYPESAVMGPACFMQLFDECTKLTEAPSLPAETLSDSCYMAMFEDCKNLKASPELPAKTLTECCYSSMFACCTSLTSIGKIAATKIEVDETMDYMFLGCSSLKVVETTAGDKSAFLKIETLTDSNSVEDMFKDCKEGSITQPEAGKSYKCVVE